MITELTQVTTVSVPTNFRIDKVLAHGAIGAAYNYSAFLNTKSKTGESWDPKKASRAILIGLIAGLLTAILYPEGEVGGTSFEKMLLVAPAILDQLGGAGKNISTQIEHSQFADWGEDWFADGRTPETDQETNSDLSKSSKETGSDWPNDSIEPTPEPEPEQDPHSIDPEEYFAAISPDDEDEG